MATRTTKNTKEKKDSVKTTKKAVIEKKTAKTKSATKTTQATASKTTSKKNSATKTNSTKTNSTKAKATTAKAVAKTTKKVAKATQSPKAETKKATKKVAKASVVAPSPKTKSKPGTTKTKTATAKTATAKTATAKTATAKATKPAKTKTEAELMADFLTKLGKYTDFSRVAKAKTMLRSSRFQLFSELHDDHLTGIVRSQTSYDLLYSCRVDDQGNFACCTQNLNPCGGLRGKPCKHILVLVIGLAQAGEVPIQTVEKWIQKSGSPVLNKETMSETFLKYKGVEAGEVEWRPIETIPEDYYAF